MRSAGRTQIFEYSPSLESSICQRHRIPAKLDYVNSPLMSCAYVLKALLTSALVSPAGIYLLPSILTNEINANFYLTSCQVDPSLVYFYYNPILLYTVRACKIVSDLTTRIPFRHVNF